jgi:hypothetical protein
MIGRSILCAIAIAAAFALILFLTTWHIPGCQSPLRSISVDRAICGGVR